MLVLLSLFISFGWVTILFLSIVMGLTSCLLFLSIKISIHIGIFALVDIYRVFTAGCRDSYIDGMYEIRIEVLAAFECGWLEVAMSCLACRSS